MTASVMVQELTGTECGEWHVHTRGSIHIFDLDAWTVERQPGPNTWADPSDAPRRLRTIERCRVGERGHWTMKSDDYLIDRYFHYTSIIQWIDGVDAKERGKEGSQEPNRSDPL
jgi:hypothetical protein